MANYSELLNDINAAIYENNDQEIDALEVRAILREMVTSLGSGFLFKGIATPSSPSGTGTYEPDQNVFYLATTAGTYTYLGGLVVAAGEVAFLCYDGTWTKKSSALLSTGSIVDNTTTEDATKPLSAKQGKVLADAEAATAAEVTALGHKVDDLGTDYFKKTQADTTQNGVTITWIDDKTFILSGTATANTNWLISNKGYAIDASKTHRILIECSNSGIDPYKVYAYFGGYKADNTQSQGSAVRVYNEWTNFVYQSDLVLSRVQFHIDSGVDFGAGVTYKIHDAIGETVAEMRFDISAIRQDLENDERFNIRGSLIGKGGTYIYREIYGLLPGQRYCLNLSGWDLTGVTPGNIIFEICNFVGSDYTRLAYTTALNVDNHYSFIVPNVSDYIKIGGRVSSGKTALWEIVPDDSHLLGEAGQYLGEKISLNEYKMMRWFNLLDYGSLSLNMASQGFDIWGDFLFQAGAISGDATANNIAIIDLKNRKILGQFEFTDTSYHMNNVNCGDKYADSDTYPVLYISQTYGAHKCCAIRLANDLSGYTILQEIVYTGSAHLANSNAFDWFIDLDGGFIYAYGNSGSVARVEIVKFAMPALSVTSVSLSDADVLDSFTIDIPAYYQGTRVIGGKLFAPCGMGNSQYPAHLIVIDLSKKAIVSDVNFGTNVGEIEGCAPYYDLLVINNVSTNPLYRTLKF